MKLNVTALSITCAITWGGAVLFVGWANLAWPGYGRAFLDVTASIYPGYHPGSGAGSVVTGTLYALLDGAVGGAVFAWLYNFLTGKFSRRA
jgi:hypothetical protein